MDDENFKTIKRKMSFHPTDTPRGMLYYNLDELTNKQKIDLNELKINTIRDNEKYFQAHPEIRALISILTNKLLTFKPRIKIYEFIGKFFKRTEDAIREEIDNYLSKKTQLAKESLSAYNLTLSMKPKEVIEIIEEKPSDYICDDVCVCDHAMTMKLEEYEPYDIQSENITDPWLSPEISYEELDDEEGQEIEEEIIETEIEPEIQEENLDENKDDEDDLFFGDYTDFSDDNIKDEEKKDEVQQQTKVEEEKKIIEEEKLETITEETKKDENEGKKIEEVQKTKIEEEKLEELPTYVEKTQKVEKKDEKHVKIK